MEVKQPLTRFQRITRENAFFPGGGSFLPQKDRKTQTVKGDQQANIKSGGSAHRDHLERKDKVGKTCVIHLTDKGPVITAQSSSNHQTRTDNR